MKLCTFSAGGAARPGLVLGSGVSPDACVLDLHAKAVADVLGFTPVCLEEIMASHLDAVRALADREWTEQAIKPLAGIRFLAPCITTGKVLGVARNFHCACAQMKSEPPAAPLWFAKLPNTLIGSGEAIQLADGCGNVTYEGEVGLVIGARASNVSVADAPKFIGGYTIVNDLTGAAIIREDNGSFLRGKNMDTFCPMGPYVVTADEIADPHNLRITLEVDGKRLQDGNTKNMVFNMFELVSRLSRTMTLEPGDVIAAGTPAGAAAAHTPPAWLCPGQTIRITVEGLGELVNTVR